MHIKLTKLTLGMMLVFLALVWIIPAQVASHDGLTIIDRLAVQQADGRLRFYNVDNAGKLSLLIELPDFGFRGEVDDTYPRWEIPSPSSIVISPDGQRFAFTAGYADDPATTTLFIYALGQSELRQVLVPGLGELHWSPRAPNVDTILLAPPDPPGIVTSGFDVDELYSYDLVSNTLTRLSNRTYYREPSINWLPNGRQIVASRTVRRCDPPCIATDDLHILDMGYMGSTSLTDLSPQLRADIPDVGIDHCHTRSPTWSASNARFYFVLNCRLNNNGLSFDAVYSVDGAGDSRLELDLLSDFSEDWHIDAVAIYPASTSEAVYVVATGVPPRATTDATFTNTWRVYQITSDGGANIIVEVDDGPPTIQTTALSPDERWLAVGSSARFDGRLAIVDLSSGAIAFYPLIDRHNSVLVLDWLDNDHLLHSEMAFVAEQGYQPFAVWILDTTTGERTTITDDMDGSVWIIPKRDVPSISD